MPKADIIYGVPLVIERTETENGKIRLSSRVGSGSLAAD